MKRLLVAMVLVGVFATCATRPAFSQDAREVSAQQNALAKRMKATVKYDATYDPKYRVMVHLKDGTKVIGHIREVHDEDFILDPGANQQPRTIVYAEHTERAGASMRRWRRKSRRIPVGERC